MKQYLNVLERYCSWTQQYIGPKFYLDSKPQKEHYKSHGLSYIGVRETYKTAGIVMGFDNPELKTLDDKVMKK